MGFHPGDGGVFIPVMELFYPGDGTVLSQWWNRFIPVILGTNLKSVFPLKDTPYSCLPFFPKKHPVTRSLVAFKAPQQPHAGDGGPWGQLLTWRENLSKSLGLSIPKCPQGLLLFLSPWGCFTCLGQP